MLDYVCQADEDMFNGKSTQEHIEWYRLRTRPLIHNPFRKRPFKYAPRGTGDEDAHEELELDDAMEDNLPVWLPSRPDEGPSNTQPIPISVQPEEPR
ncbi:hypothetical protein AMTR_s00062p00199800 [Amborella trichopoda]|uniref:Uncharacterized protein n=1 Tax=Amborella trichopoda TaxID=13333 RepID=U5DBX1_AMBTC|nr:hypothetical protein AMTR_s00062p00199800 [Amborella trichopoda]